MSEGFKNWYKELNKSGTISPVSLGMNRTDLIGLFGEPENLGAFTSKGNIPQILKYEEVEFHFNVKNGDKLFMIYRESANGNVELIIKSQV